MLCLENYERDQWAYQIQAFYFIYAKRCLVKVTLLFDGFVISQF